MIIPCIRRQGNCTMIEVGDVGLEGGATAKIKVPMTGKKGAETGEGEVA